MSRWLIAVYLAVTMAAPSMTVFAQAAAAPAPGETTTEEPADPCAAPPVDVAADAPAAPDQPSPEPGAKQDELGRVGADGLPCPPLEQPAGATPEVPADASEDESPDENLPPEPPETGKAEDFEPDEEISEDYPVPLPSDI